MSIKSNYPSVQPSAVFDFAAAKKLDPRVTYTRAGGSTSASYLGDNGYIQYASVDEPRFTHEPIVRENILPYSNAFNNWTGSEYVLGANQEVAPDGSYTADRILDNAVSAQHNVYKSSVSEKGVYTFSVYAKHYPGNNDVVLRMATYHATSAAAGVDSVALFNLRTGKRTEGIQGGATPSKMEYVGNGWYRCSITTGEVPETTGIYLGVAHENGTFNYAGDGTRGFYLWGAQGERGSEATDLIITNSQAVEDTKLVSKGLLVEVQRTNYVANSNMSSVWINNNPGASVAATIFGNTLEVLAPDGSNTAAKVVQANSGWQRVAIGATLPNNTGYYTWSGFVKRGNSAECVFEVTGQWSAGGRVTWNFDSETLTPANSNFTNLGYQKYPNGWYRIYGRWLGSTSDGGTSGTYWFFPGADFNGTPAAPAGYTYTWGFQIEQNHTLTSVIITDGTTKTRSPDAPVIFNFNGEFDTFWSTDQGTLISECEYGPGEKEFGDKFARGFQISNASAAIGLAQYIEPGSENTYFRYRADEENSNAAAFVTNYNGDIDPSPNAVRSGFMWGPDGIAVCGRGEHMYYYFGDTVKDGLDRIYIGIASNFASVLNGTYKKLIFYPSKVSEFQLQTLTTPEQ